MTKVQKKMTIVAIPKQPNEDELTATGQTVIAVLRSLTPFILIIEEEK